MIEVIRIMRYVYNTYEEAEADMARWINNHYYGDGRKFNSVNLPPSTVGQLDES